MSLAAPLTADLDEIRATHNHIADFVAKHSDYDVSKDNLWDEVAAAVLIDPSLVTNASPKYLDVIIDHQRKYGAVMVSNGVRPDVDQ